MAAMARLLASRGQFRFAWDPRLCAAAATATFGAASLCKTGPTLHCNEAHGHGHSHEGTHGHAHDAPAQTRRVTRSPTQRRFADTSDAKAAAGRLNKNLLLAIPKKGRLHDKVKVMLQGAGIEYTRKDRIDIAHSSNLPISIVFLPAKDIATYVGEGEVDLGITGEDCVAESNVEVDVLMPLGFGKCNLSVQAPRKEKWTAEQLAGKSIVTSFPIITQKFFASFEELGKPTRIKFISGSVEAACGLGLADGIVDLVETGTTMKAAGLEEVAVVMKSQAVLIANRHTTNRELVDTVQRRITGWLTAQDWAMVTYNVPRDSLSACEQITPGKKSPTVMPLEEPGWVAVSALVPKKKSADIMDELEKAGAKDIILSSILIYR